MTLRLVPLVVEHLPHVMTWVNDHEVMQYFAMRQAAIEEDDERRYLETFVRSANDRAWSVFDEDQYVGQTSINQIYGPARNGRLFLVVRRDMQHKGYGRAALAATLARAWGELDLHKVWLIVRRDNKKAQAMYLEAGFEFEGVLRDEYCVGERFFDMVRMGALRPS